MMTDSLILPVSGITGRGSSLNPFIVLDEAARFIDFAGLVFGAQEVSRARTTMPDGRLIHAELELGDSLLLLADRLHGWPARPGLFQIWVSDIEAILGRGTDCGTSVITPPTPFYGAVTLARMQDPWGNLWWMYQPARGSPIRFLPGKVGLT
jgi:uncharacterized glyoxalase superfamily protein PhnB